LLLLLSLAAAAAPLAAHPPAALQLPPLQQEASSERHPGKVVWMELVTPDLRGAQHFYGGLFGWTFQAVPGMHALYRIALNNGTPVAGFVQPRAPRGGRRQPAWLPFIAARDVSALKDGALKRGAKVLSPPRAYPQRGEQALLADPQGAVFGVLASSSGDPPDELVDVGGWIWAALLTTNPKSGVAFYQGLFGYDVQPLPGKDGSSHLLLSSEGFARASINTLPRRAKKDSPYWLSFVRVQNTAAAVAQVKSLGGSVITEPHPNPDGSLVAVVADPAGTPFGVLEWTQEASTAPATEEHPR
jgi:predicted enzyme related to lactoylglutathione lyase